MDAFHALAGGRSSVVFPVGSHQDRNHSGADPELSSALHIECPETRMVKSSSTNRRTPPALGPPAWDHMYCLAVWNCKTKITFQNLLLLPISKEMLTYIWKWVSSGSDLRRAIALARHRAPKCCTRRVIFSAPWSTHKQTPESGCKDTYNTSVTDSDTRYTLTAIIQEVLPWVKYAPATHVFVIHLVGLFAVRWHYHHILFVTLIVIGRALSLLPQVNQWKEFS